jgi:hypothetical protein
MGTFVEIALRVMAEQEARKQAEVCGVTAADVLRVFPGSRILSSLHCCRCGGKMMERLERRRHVFRCGRCGTKKRAGA